MTGIPKAKGIKKNGRRAVAFAVRVTRAGVTPGLIPYFFWSSIFYISAGVYSFLTLSTVHEFLCSIPAERLGCSSCSDNLLMCGKGSTPEGKCWQYSMNLTLQKYFNGLAGDIAEFDTAAVDTMCNSLVPTSTDPVNMLTKIIEVRKSLGADIVGPECIRFHCRVMQNAFTLLDDSIDNGDLVGTGSCSNDWGLKPPDEATSCPCNILSLGRSSTALAEAFAELCLPLTTKFEISAFQHMLRDKPACYRDAVVDQSRGANALAFDSFMRDNNCTQFLPLGLTVFSWFYFAEQYRLQLEIVGSKFQMHSTCATVMCSAFAITLPPAYGCDWTSSQELRGVSRVEIEAVSAVCTAPSNSLGSGDDIITRICSHVVDPGTIPLCMAPGSTLAPSEGGAASRRLPLAEDVAMHKPTTVSFQHFGGDAGGNGSFDKMGRAFWAANSTRDGALLVDGAAATGRSGPPHANVTPASRQGLATLTAPEAPKRHLQTVSEVASEGNDGLPDYEVGEWSRCSCYQACVGGVRTRSVTCPSSVACREPRPPAAEPCECWHCAACNVYYTVLFFSLGYFSQGVIAFFMWLAFWRISSYDDDDWSDVGCSTKILGFFCKFLPGVIRFFTCLTFAFLGVIVFQAFIPGLEQHDCKEIKRLQLMAVLVTTVWALQLFVGITMARKEPMPPWLHNENTNKRIRFLCTPCRAIGP